MDVLLKGYSGRSRRTEVSSCSSNPTVLRVGKKTHPPTQRQGNTQTQDGTCITVLLPRHKHKRSLPCILRVPRARSAVKIKFRDGPRGQPFCRTKYMTKTKMRTQEDCGKRDVRGYEIYVLNVTGCKHVTIFNGSRCATYGKKRIYPDVKQVQNVSYSKCCDLGSSIKAMPIRNSFGYAMIPPLLMRDGGWFSPHSCGHIANRARD